MRRSPPITSIQCLSKRRTLIARPSNMAAHCKRWQAPRQCSTSFISADANVAVTRPYQGRRRMTLTFPIINRSRLILWLVTGGEKAQALAHLRNRDRSIPGSRVDQERALVLADRAAAARLGSSEKLEA